MVGATSRPDMLDAALLRPGRLDRLLYCGFPSARERLQVRCRPCRHGAIPNTCMHATHLHPTQRCEKGERRCPMLWHVQVRRTADAANAAGSLEMPCMPVMAQALLDVKLLLYRY